LKSGTIILLCLFTFSSLGFMKIMEPVYKGYFKDIISHNKSTISTIIISESAMKAMRANELFDNNEFMYKGKLFDIIAISQFQNKYYIKCKFDKLEQGFISLVEEYVKAIHQNSHDNKVPSISLEKDSNYYALTKVNLSKKFSLLYSIETQFQYLFSIKSFFAIQLSLPPITR
jgi:hypothetical protein